MTTPAIEARIELDKPRRLLFDDAGLRRYEKAAGHPITDLQSAFDPADLAILLWAMAVHEDPTATPDQIKASLTPKILYNVSDMLRQIGTLIKRAAQKEATCPR